MVSAVASCLRARGIVWFTMDIVPPPTNFLVLMSPRSGSMPVVSQSMRNPMVPVGASTVTWELRTPADAARRLASSQPAMAASTMSSSTEEWLSERAASRCIPSTSSIGSAFSA